MKTQVVLALLFLMNTAWARSAGAEIKGFHLQSCGQINCLEIKSDLGFSGLGAQSFAFEKAQFSIENKKTKKRTELQARDVFYDIDSQMVFLRGVEAPQGQQVIYDIRTEELMWF